LCCNLATTLFFGWLYTARKAILNIKSAKT
jgi:hypothetical protein